MSNKSKKFGGTKPKSRGRNSKPRERIKREGKKCIQIGTPRGTREQKLWEKETPRGRTKQVQTSFKEFFLTEHSRKRLK